MQYLCRKLIIMPISYSDIIRVADQEFDMDVSYYSPISKCECAITIVDSVTGDKRMLNVVIKADDIVELRQKLERIKLTYKMERKVLIEKYKLKTIFNA